MKPPVIFLAFANGHDDHLELLEMEAREIFQELQDLHDRQCVEVIIDETASTQELFRHFSRYGGRMAVFHYGGHADSTKLILRGGGAQSEGLAKLLAGRAGKRLRLVVLNGCSTGEQVRAFLDAGAGAVIATSVPVADDMAVRFSIGFYHLLAGGSSIREAYEKAIALLQTQSKQAPQVQVLRYRSAGFEEEAPNRPQPWALYVAEGKEGLLGWKLPRHSAARRKNVALAAFLVVALLALATLFWFLRNQPFNLEVLVNRPSDTEMAILRKGGRVSMDLDGDKRESALNDEGRAYFKDIPAGFLRRPVRIAFEHNEPYRLVNEDTLFRLRRNGVVQLDIKLKNLDRLFGHVIDQASGKPLEQVKVSVRSVHAYTNAEGYFDLHIPDSLQARLQTVRFSKAGYLDAIHNDVPVQTRQAVGLGMVPEGLSTLPEAAVKTGS